MENTNAKKIDNSDVWVCTEESKITETKIENDDDGKKYILEGVATQAEFLNRNKRFYKLDPMIREAESYQTEIQNGRAVGELNHSGELSINPERIAIKILEYERIGETNDFRHKSQVLPYGLGLLVIGHMDHGIQIATSSRAAGKLLKTKDMVIVEDLKLITPADVVWNNSAPSAIPTYIKEDVMNMIFESVDLMQSVYATQIIEESKYLLHRTPKNGLKDVINKIYDDILKMKI
jgi:hypothetical protein